MYSDESKMLAHAYGVQARKNNCPYVHFRLQLPEFQECWKDGYREQQMREKDQ